MSDVKVEKSKRLGPEIVRFIVVGIVATIFDFGTYSLFAWFCQKFWGFAAKDIWVTVIATTAGFIVGVIVNYILSLIWVFQNVDKEKKMNKGLHAFLFVILSAVGLFIGLGIMAGFKYLWIAVANIDIDTWMNVPAGENWLGYVLSSGTFWLFAFSFVVKTLIVLFYNYISRKKILFKAPKEAISETHE